MGDFPGTDVHYRPDVERLETGEPVTVSWWYLPEPWRDRWRSSNRMTVHGDGTITEAPRGT